MADSAVSSTSSEDDYMNLGDNGDGPSEGWDTNYPYRSVRDRRFASSSRPTQSYRLLKNKIVSYDPTLGDNCQAGAAHQEEGSTQATEMTRWPRPRHGALKQQFLAQLKNHEDDEKSARSDRAAQNQGVASPHQICDLKTLNDDDIMNGIAAMWQVLDPKASKFAFGIACTIRSTQHNRKALINEFIPVVGWPKPLLIPLLFSGQEREEEFRAWARCSLYNKLKSGVNSVDLIQKLMSLSQQPTALLAYLEDHVDPDHVDSSECSELAESFIRQYESAMAAKEAMAQGTGHYVLVVAERKPDVDNVIKFTIMNSIRFTPMLDSIRSAATNVVNHSGWIPSGLPQQKFGNLQAPDVIQQSGNYSGIHVILNAWAYMLDLFPNPRPEKRMSRVFYNHALQVINLALSGHMDIHTVQAFFNAHGFARQQLNYAVQGSVYMAEIAQSTLQDTVRNLHQRPDTGAKDTAAGENPLEAVSATKRGDTIKLLTKSTQWKPPVARMIAKEGLPKAKVYFEEPGERSINGTTVQRAPPNQSATEAPSNLAESNELNLECQRATMRSRFPDTPASNPSVGPNESRQLLPHRVHADTLLEDDDLHLAIAALTQGIDTQRSSLVFAYGLPQHFQTLRQADFAAAANLDSNLIGGPRPLIMPLVFNWQDRSREEGAVPGSNVHEDNFSGHSVVAFAERIYDPESPVNIQLTIIDSAEGNVSRDRIVQGTQNIIENSNWLGRPSTHPPKPVFGEPYFVSYPRQRNGTACGLHVILNAWIFALGGLRNNRAFYPSEAFYIEAVEIINLALAGCCDSYTIRAWLQTSRYALPDEGETRDCNETVVMYGHGTLRRLWETRAEVEISEEEDRVMQQSLHEQEDNRLIQRALREADFGGGS